MADNIKYRFIENVGDYFPTGYFNEDFIDKVQKTSGYSSEDMVELSKPYVKLRREYDAYKNYIINTNPRTKDAIKHTHDFNSKLLEILGYQTDDNYEFYMVDEEEQSVVPVRQVLRHGNGVSMLIMEMQHLIQIGDQQPSGLFEQKYNEDGDEQTVRHQRYYAGQWSEVFTLPTEYHISPAIINKAIDAIFLLPPERRPHFILMMAGNTVFLLDSERWSQESYLQFSLDELFSQASISAFRKYYALFHLLVCKNTLAADSETVLMDRLLEESYKNAYEVTKDLKIGVVKAVETLANEALYWWKQNDNIPVNDYTDHLFESQVKDDCLTIVYRLLFIFYAESRDELEILPTDDEVYNRGYSLEMLRDLEQIHLISQASKDGYFFHESLSKLFGLLSSGYHESSEEGDKTFSVRHIDSPLFNDKKLHHLGTVKFRNEAWQNIIRYLSLNRKKPVGRISYANLGVNQLGSVYESLLAYRGFYAEEDYIEVHSAGSTSKDDTFLVPYSRMDDFEPDEILYDEEGSPVILKKGTFVYRLNGRDRQKSASYYTPEILTQSTVKYTLKTIIDEVAQGKRKAIELLDLKILEPAMGAAAFQNEVITQLAKAYLTYQEQDRKRSGVQNWRLSPDHYRDELQKIKAYIATHNVYGMDLNPTAIELGKLALWLNVIHKDMETPYFSNRLALGNAVIGAWLKVYNKEDIIGIKSTKGKKEILLQNKWWEKAPHRVSFQKNGIKRSVNEVYHFLLPDANMLAVRTIKDYKDKAKKERQDALNPHKPTDDALQRMNTFISDWTAPINDDDLRRLQRISGKFDVLLKEFYQFQLSVENQTQNKMNLWGVPGAPVLNIDLYDEKERLNNIRYQHGHPYFRLKMVMDYWCALWFWQLEDVDLLPTRSEYWADIETMLNVSDDQLDSRTSRAINRGTGFVPIQHSLFSEYEEPNLFSQADDYEEKTDIKLLNKDAILRTGSKGTTFFDQSTRFKIVKKLSDRYHFFHPMLEFIEVFWLRNGFDIICGNPPWIKLQFDDQGVISERFPEVAIRKLSAPEARKKMDEFLKDKQLEAIYQSEQEETACSAAFLNAYANYPLLIGQQTNLYKCILENTFNLSSENGFIGLLTPESIYDDPKGQPLRKELYKRLRYHFQYTNELRLFAEVHHQTTYGNQILGPRRDLAPHFVSLSNLFHPVTIDACFSHEGHGKCEGIKDTDGKWNTSGHAHRMVNVGSEELKVLAKTFEASEEWEGTKLVSIHNCDTVKILKSLSSFRTHVGDYETLISEGLHETGAVDKGWIKRETKYPNQDKFEMIYSGPHIYVGNPLYKNPRLACTLNSDYDIIDLVTSTSDQNIRTNYIPKINLTDYRKLIKGFNKSHKEKDWIDYYKSAVRLMTGGGAGERTLTTAILPPKSSHIVTIISTCFKSSDLLLEYTSLCSSIVLDFFIKTIGCGAIHASRIESFPLGISRKFKPSLFARTLRLNCLTNRYSELWEECWMPEYKEQKWSVKDPRLATWDKLSPTWNHDSPLRNYFERRLALVEIDVLAAMALGLTLDELIMMYEIQFPVLQANENDTWYDRNGRIVFTCSKGLTGVGLDRPKWDSIKGKAIGDSIDKLGSMEYEGVSPTYTHTLTSELYNGHQITYEAPYNRCDRIADYRRAWEHFSYLLKEQ